MKLCLTCRKRFDDETWECPACGYHPPLRDGCLSFAPDLADENDGFTQEYFDQLIELEAGHFWFRARNKLIIWALQTYFPGVDSFLEVGCGTGFVLSGIRAACPHIRLCGSEIFSRGLQFAQQRSPEVNLFQMDARQIPFSQEFDVVGAFDVLEHIEEDQLVLQQLFQAVKPGGGLIITVPQHRFLWSVVDELSFHKRRYRRIELVTKVEHAGFRLVRTTSFVSLLFPLMLLSRLKQQANQDNLDLMAEYKIGATLQRVLGSILNVERAMIQNGVSFPVGGSLLLIARKV
ncbi:class I SAM-dependent methyltransferase [Leptothermofonsia sp. ETS-13]|uniref:class I SAM-dependent methyltransferase n=1 Tax=Leptothermofonsia sp. ETS-13 TaxID=3035696 RepID=UPI003BA13786